MADASAPQCLPTGVPGLDEVLNGGLPVRGIYLLAGGPGTGKTTLSLQFLREGVRRNETSLYLSLSQPIHSAQRIAASHGIPTEGITMHGLTRQRILSRIEARQDVFHASEVELGELTDEMHDVVKRLRPTRVAFDSLSLIELLAGDKARYRQELLSLITFFDEQEVTALVTLTAGALGDRGEAQALSDGVLLLQQLDTDFGGQRLRIMVEKLRGRSFQGGFHDFAIRRGGVIVYPRPVHDPTMPPKPRRVVSSGSEGIDTMLGGGLSTGTSCLIVGPAGAGKTSLAMMYAHRAALRGDGAAVFLFEEAAESYLMQAAALGMDLREHIEAGRLSLVEIDNAVLSAGEFSSRVREVLRDDLVLVVIDSLSGYLRAGPREELLYAQLRDLVTFLDRRGVLTLMTLAQMGAMGQILSSPLNLSEAADAVVVLRYFEAAGRVRKAMSILKKRYGSHEIGLRELRIGSSGITLGGATSLFEGVLSSTPRFTGGEEDLPPHP